MTRLDGYFRKVWSAIFILIICIGLFIAQAIKSWNTYINLHRRVSCIERILHVKDGCVVNE